MTGLSDDELRMFAALETDLLDDVTYTELHLDELSKRCLADGGLWGDDVDRHAALMREVHADLLSPLQPNSWALRELQHREP